MENAFTDVANTTSETFADVKTPENQEGPSGLPPAVIEKTARMAAIGNVDVAAPRSELLDMINAETELNVDTIKKLGDEGLRREAAFKEQSARVQSLIGLKNSPETLIDPSIASGIEGAVQATLQEDAAASAKTALEDRAIKNITALAASGDTTQARIAFDNLTMGDADERLINYNKKQYILQREIDKAGLQDDNAGWFAHAMHFTVSVVNPVYDQLTSTHIVDIDNAMNGWLSAIVSGAENKRESDGLWNNSLSAEDFSKIVSEQVIPNGIKRATFMGLFDKSAYLNTLTKLNHADALKINTLDAINVAGFLPWGKIAKLGTIPSMLARAGARRETEQLLARAAADMMDKGTAVTAEKMGVTEADVVDNILPTSHSIDGAVTKVPVGVDTGISLERRRELEARLPDTLSSERFKNDAERQVAVDALVKTIERETERDLKDVAVKEVDNPLAGGSSTTRLELTIGKKTGGGYATERSARIAANKLAYDTAELVQDESGQWFFKIQKDMPEAGFWTNTLQPARAGLASRFLSGARNLIDPFLANLGQQSGNSRNIILKSLSDDYIAAIKPLPGWQKDQFKQIVKIGENRAEWYNREQFNTLYERAFKRNPSDEEWNLYQTHIRTNDLEHIIRNDDLYKQKVVKGSESVKFEAAGLSVDIDAVINRSLDDMPEGRSFNAADGVHYNKDNPLTPTELKRLKDKGMILVSAEKPIKLPDGTDVEHFFVKPSDASVSLLRREQLAYRAGGHRFYEGKWFARQAVKGVQPDTLEKFLKNPNTYIVGMSKAEVKAYVDVMEAARVVYNTKGSTTADIAKVLEGHKGLPSAEEFVQGIKDELYRADTPFVVNYDRELPVEYNVNRDYEAQFLGDAEESSYTGFMRTNGRMYYSGRGTQLRDYMGELAPTLDPFEAINRSLRNVANISSFSDYKLTSIERWVKTYEGHIGNLPPDASNLTKFNEGKLAVRPGYDNNKIKQAAEAQRAIIRRNLGWRSDIDRAIEQTTVDLQQWIIGDSPKGLRHNLGVKATQWWSNQDPIQAMRGLATDLKLGLFNPAQLILQASSSVAALSLSPRFGLQGMFTHYPLRLYLSKAGNEKMLTELADRFAVHAGMPKEEYKDFLRFWKKSGFFNFNTTHQMINQVGPHVATSEMGNIARTTREYGRFFWNEGETFNRGVAARIAWGEVRKAHPELKIMSPEFNRKVSGAAEVYAQSMSKESSAAWQNGPMSVPTQFWAYNARMLEAMLPAWAGGTKELSGAQKLRLVIGQTVLYGSSGFPLANVISNHFKAQSGEAPKIDTILGVADRGLVDTFIHATTGEDIAVGSRLGTGNWIGDTVRDLLGQSPYGEKSAWDVTTGATGSVARDTLLPVIKWVKAESGDRTHPLTSQDFKTWIANVSTVNYALKASMIAQYGILVSSKGTVLLDDLPGSAAAAQLLGFGPGGQDQITAMTAHNKMRKESIDDAAKVIRNLRTKMAHLPASEQPQALGEINIFVRTLPTDIRQAALAKVGKTTDASLVDSLTKRLTKEQYDQRMIRQLEDQQQEPQQ